MKILHTADWHLGDRLGRIDRTEDLRCAVERVASYCAEERADVLVVAGDLFSELARPDSLRETVRHWQDVFQEFFAKGGTILTLTGNHDNENFCQMLTHAMNLAAPVPTTPGTEVPRGRLYLATGPTLLRLQDRETESPVQFLLMPYPTPSRFLSDDLTQKYTSVEEKNRQLQIAYAEALRTMQHDEGFDRSLPVVLAAHVHVRGARLGGSLFRLSEEDDVIFDDETLATSFDYVALGHIHKPQSIGDHPHVRYSGSIERMDLGEQGDNKSLVMVEMGPEGLRGEPTLLPLPSTPIYEVHVTNPAEDIPKLRAEYSDALSRDAPARDLVNIHLTYTAGIDNLDETLRELEEIFPRWYSRDWIEASALGPTIANEGRQTKSFAETVREYVDQELLNHPDEEREEILSRVDELIKEMDE